MRMRSSTASQIYQLLCGIYKVRLLLCLGSRLRALHWLRIQRRKALDDGSLDQRRNVKPLTGSELTEIRCVHFIDPGTDFNFVGSAYVWHATDSPARWAPDGAGGLFSNFPVPMLVPP